MLGALVGAPGPAYAPPEVNPIVAENRLTGSDDWRLTRAADDASGQIKAYASSPSVNRGADLALHVSVSPAQTPVIP